MPDSDPIKVRNMHMEAPDLNDLRASLDNIDAALIFLLTERFRVTRNVGLYKREHHLPPIDEAREAEQLARLEKLAKSSGLDASFAKRIFRCIIDEVVYEHRELLEEG